MTGSGEPSLYALSIDPRAARAGEIVDVVFRTRNLGTRPSPPATVEFRLGAGLEPLGATEHAVDPVDPGEDVVAAMRARVLPPASPESRVGVGAALHLAGSVLVSNTCTLAVRGRPVLDGGASGASVEALDAGTVRVRAVLTNEGDGPACGVRLAVPAPIGCVRLDGDGPALLELERLDPGEHAELAFDARVVEPVAEIRAEDGELRFGDGRCVSLPVREVVATVAALAAPHVTVVPSRRRLDVTVDLRNDGWSDARDVGVRIAASHACLDAGSILVDDVPAARTSRRHARRDGATALASLRRDGDATIVDVALIPARGNLRIAFVAAPFAASSEGTFTVAVGGRAVEAPYAVPPVREVRLRAIEMPQRVSPGESAAFVVRVANAGDVDENVMVAVAASAAAERSGPAECAIRPGSFVDVSLDVDVPEDVGDGDAFRPIITAFDSTGERARVSATSVARHRKSLDAGAEPKLDDDDDERPIRALVHAALRAPSTALAGAPIGISLDLDVEDAADAIAIRTDPPQGTRYVPGSARLDDRALLDRTGTPDASSPLEGEGLTLRAVPAGTRVTLAWSLLTDPATDGATVDVTAVVEVDGEPHVVAPAGVELRARDPFAARPAGMPYHVEACSLGPARAPADEAAASPAPLEFDRERPYEIDPAEVAAAPATLTMRLTRARVDEVGRLLHGARGRGLVAHLFALRLFFPDGVEPPDAVAAAQLDALNAALRDVYDRLFVKLRIPGFAACADDLEDPALRAALVVFSDRLGGAGFADVPFGAPAALRALVGLRPARCDDDPSLVAAISRYAELVDGVLAEYEGLPLELFDDALARRDDPALDEARDTVLAALRAHLVTAQIAC